MKSKTAFVASFTSLFFIGYAVVWYSLSLLGAVSLYGNLQQAFGDGKFHLTAITDTYEMTTRLLVGFSLGMVVWNVKQKAQQKT
jgi:hypothetical protein